MDLKSIKTITIAGAGVMGSSIAQIFASFDYKVTLYDVSDLSIHKSKELIALNQKTSVAQGVSTKEDSERDMANISFTCDKECFKTTDFVIEAIVENMDIKHSFWSEVSSMAKEDAILTTNTSGLSITEIAKAVKNPERFCGMHWVNPPHIVPLVEVIKGEKTSDDIASLVYQLSLAIGKEPILIKKESQGFVLNRFQFTILREAMYIVESGIASKEDVDKVFKYGLGMRYACLGPFEIADLGGLDTFYNISSYLFKDLEDTKDVHHMLSDIVDKGNFGVKSKKGFYDYSNGRDKEVIEKRDSDFLKISKCLYENNKENMA